MSGLVELLLSVTTAFDPWAVLALFVICAVGEFGVPVPYVLETMWLLVGFQVASGQLSVPEALGLWLAAQAGRQVGCLGLYHTARAGAPVLGRFFRGDRGSRLLASPMVDRLRVRSAFSVAMGRLVGLRMPLTMLAGGTGTLRPLLGGVFLSSVVFDGLFLVMGMAVGTATALTFPQMLVLSLGGLTGLYATTVVIRLARRRLARRPVG